MQKFILQLGLFFSSIFFTHLLNAQAPVKENLHHGHNHTPEELKQIEIHETQHTLEILRRTPKQKPSDGTPKALNCASDNYDFEAGNTNGWITANNVQLMTGGNDPYSGLPRVYPGGGGNSVRLGDDEGAFNGTISRAIAVPSTGITSFSFHFAICIFNFPHSAAEAARFTVRFYDQNNNLLPCPTFDCYYASDEGAVGVPTFNQTANVMTFYNPSALGAGSYNVSYSQWNDVNVDLTPYAGQTITAVFQNQQCIYGPDWSYAYLDVDCPSSDPEEETLCMDIPGTLTGEDGVGTKRWYNSAGTQIASGLNLNITAPGDYTYGLTPTGGGCGAGVEKLFLYHVKESPKAQFNTANNCVDANSIFTNTSINGASYEWDFGDASNSTVTSPTHLYAGPGTYITELVVTAANGCTDTITNPITIHPKPVIVFTVPNVCSNLTSVFTDASTIVTGTIASWNWNFGGANTSAVQNPSFNFGAAGAHPVTLTATSNFGCVQSLTQNATTYALPIANFTVASVCSGLTSSFVDISTVAGPEVIDTWAWTFSDAQVSALQNPTHNFPNEGIYANTLLVTTANGCTGTTTLNNTVWPLPVPSFTVPNNCFATNSVFTNTSTISSVNTPNTISNYAWNFGNGATSSLSAPTHLYSAPGTYTVRLIATSQHGCIDSTRSNFTVYSLPIADFSVDPTCFGVGSEFVDFSTIILPDVISSWNWSFGDNTTSSIQSPTHLFPSQNNYSNRLIITSNQGCKDTIVKTNTVWPLPNVDFSITDVCLNFANVFTDNSIISNQHTSNSNVGWLWTLGDGSVIPTQNGTHTYAADGTYNVQLRVTSNHGCRDSLTKVATVHPKPNAIVNGVDLTGCSPICPSITSISTVNAPGVITNLQWVYSDGAIGNGTNSIRCFENTTDHTELYDVTLFVQTDKGCKDTSTNLNYIQVYHLPIANFTYLPSDPDIHRNRVEFTNTSLYASTYEWEFSNAQTSILVSPDIEFDNGPGFYTAQLIATTYNGCKDTVIREILVKDVVTYWIPNTFTPNSDVFNNTWKPVIYSGIDEFSIHIMVFNRWGEMIWESFDPNVGWDGNYGGTPVQDGTCTWKFEYKVKGIDKRQTDVGHVNILR